jgi:hypothetical protein
VKLFRVVGFTGFFDVLELDIFDDYRFFMLGGIGRDFDPEKVDLFFQTGEASEMLAGFVKEVGIIGTGIAADKIILVGSVGFKGEVRWAVDCDPLMAFSDIWKVPVT